LWRWWQAKGSIVTERDEQIELLKLKLEDVEKERNRLRDARPSFTARLGPLPASAAVVTGIIASAAGEVDWWYAAGAGLVFAVLLTVSTWFGGLKPYREFRGRKSIVFRPDHTNLEQWLKEKIDFEQRVYGKPAEPKYQRWPARRPGTLTQALNSERAAANIVQALSVVILAILVVGIAIGT
jgi:hypothetical protein